MVENKWDNMKKKSINVFSGRLWRVIFGKGNVSGLSKSSHTRTSPTALSHALWVILHPVPGFLNFWVRSQWTRWSLEPIWNLNKGEGSQLFLLSMAMDNPSEAELPFFRYHLRSVVFSPRNIPATIDLLYIQFLSLSLSLCLCLCLSISLWDWKRTIEDNKEMMQSETLRMVYSRTSNTHWDL